MKKAGIIGAGIGGIGTAIRLQLKGYDVSVFEANEYAGGKLGEFWVGDYRFDSGPSLFTMPRQVEELFELAGVPIEPYFTYERLDPVCRYFYEDGTVLDAKADQQAFAKEVAAKTGVTEAQIGQLLERSRELYDITGHVFLEKSLHKLKTFLLPDTLRSILKLHRIDAFRSMHQANAAQFQDPRVVQLFNRYATYNGSDPYQAPATLNVIPHLEFNQGAFLPKEGMVAIPRALIQLAKDLGVKFHLNQPVDKIEVENQRATGIWLNGEFEPFDVVVSNMDVVPTYRKLLADQPAPERTLNQPRSSSALIFYWGVNKNFPELDLHNIFFSGDYQQEFNQIWQEKTVPTDPTVYVFISSKKLEKDAPPGGENWFTMINVPANQGQDWETLTLQAREAIITKLERMLGKPVEDHIEGERVMDPPGIESWTSSFRGALYGSSSNNKFAAFLRHPNFSQRIKNLYFCGGSVHPGGGIPLSLLSARIVGDLVEPVPVAK
ncbi:MAG: 1-hydroxycarotenoid 3,4-desaturase CrtD [Bacteroidota bacterium]